MERKKQKRCIDGNELKKQPKTKNDNFENFRQK